MLILEKESEEEVADLLRRCSSMYLSGSNFLKELKVQPEFRISSPRNYVLVLLIRHQMEALDASAALTQAGRPQFVTSITRSMYETYLNALSIGWLDVQLGTVRYSPAYNARRFLAYRNILVAKYDSNVGSLANGWELLGIRREEAVWRRQLILRRAARSKRVHKGLSHKSQSWFPGGVGAMFRHLWPENKEPLFPKPLALDQDRLMWKQLFAVHWQHASNQVHANVTGLTSRVDDSRDKWPEHSPTEDFSGLQSAWSIASMTIFAAADALAKLHEFNNISLAADRISGVHR